MLTVTALRSFFRYLCQRYRLATLTANAKLARAPINLVQVQTNYETAALALALTDPFSLTRTAIIWIKVGAPSFLHPFA
jgi:hypothetical protein